MSIPRAYSKNCVFITCYRPGGKCYLQGQKIIFSIVFILKMCELSQFAAAAVHSAARRNCGKNTIFIVCSWYALGMLMVCSWYALGMPLPICLAIAAVGQHFYISPAKLQITCVSGTVVGNNPAPLFRPKLFYNFVSLPSLIKK
jgi:hypothetical protein